MVVPEPSNPFDPNALAVWIDVEELQKLKSDSDTWDALLQSCRILMANAGRLDWEEKDLLEPEAWHLGYVPKVAAAEISLRGDTPGQFTFSMEGKPAVKFEED